jgi:hypothetical protein
VDHALSDGEAFDFIGGSNHDAYSTEFETGRILAKSEFEDLEINSQFSLLNFYPVNIS